MAAEPLTLGTKDIFAHPALTQKIANKFNDYPGSRVPDNIKDPKKIIQRHIDRFADNLKYLWNDVPPEQRERTRKWYESANRMAGDMAEKYNIARRQVAGVIAALSPQTDWFVNVGRAERLLDIYHNKRDFVGTQDMMDTAKRIIAKGKEFAGEPEEGEEQRVPLMATVLDKIDGKKLSELTDPVERAAWVRLYDETYGNDGEGDRTYHEIDPATGDKRRLVTKKGGVKATLTWGSLRELSKALQVLDDGSRANISEQLGLAHKVRNFYNNIVDPSNPHDVTIDTHAVAAAHLRPLSVKDMAVLENFGRINNAQIGLKGTYPVYAEAYRQAAKDLGVLPRELQSVVWEHVREMFPDTFKSESSTDTKGKKHLVNKEAIDKLWQKYEIRKPA